jgi:quinol-cytochrome oxidoreductase complex cytochrome b subunit/mono/diheme cytochrome c family protein
MLTKVTDWLDNRTGYRALMSHALDEEIVGGARWAYVFGSALLAVFICQVVTGLLLMATYVPSTEGAWASVYYIQHKVAGGAMVRGIHHYGAQAMMIVLGIHLLQVTIYGAYKAPREVTWWIGLVLMQVVMGLGLTGYLLPWDQKGYWATKVATNIAGTIPGIGPSLQTLIVGGGDYGQATLTRFYVLHVGVLPALLALTVGVHVLMFRRNGATPPAGADLTKKEPFFPGQLFRDVAFSMLVVGAIALLAAGGGSHLDAPADPSGDYHPRPEWYFLFLFQLLKYLPGALELLGTVILPGIAVGFLFVLPFLDNKPSTRVRDRLPWLAPILVGVLGIVGLTMQAFSDDAKDQAYQESIVHSKARAERAIALAGSGIPVGGPLEMLRRDPMTQGPDVYGQQCASCHILNGEGERAAPDHTGFGSRDWILGVLLDPDADHYFGTTEISDMKPMGKLGLPALKAVTEYLFSLGHEKNDPAFDAALAEQGKAVFDEKCTRCHVMNGEGAEIFDGPDLTGYASRTWIERQIKDPEAHYGELNEMPEFADEISAHDIRMVTAYLRQQRFAKVATPPKLEAAAAAAEPAKGEKEDE